MGVVRVEGKPVTLDDIVIDAGREAIRDALSVDFPDIENAEITIDPVEPESACASVMTRSASLVKRSAPKG